MKIMCRRLLVLLLICCALLMLLPTAALAADIVASGVCGAEGSNLTWTLDSNGLLIIGGSGAMEDNQFSIPWRYRCKDITAVKINRGVTSIGCYAFSYCSSLASIEIPDSVTSIGDGVFTECSSLASIEIPDSVTSIGAGAFNGCSSLTAIAIPNCVTSVGNSAFGGCSGLTSIELPTGLTSIGNNMFTRCSSLASIDIPDGVTSIGGYAFSGCSGLTSMKIPESVMSIESGVFSGCSSLTNVYISDMDAWCRIEFGDINATPMCYAKCIYLNGEKIVNVAVPQGIATLSYTFYGFKDLIRITLPDSVTNIGDSTFRECSSLTNIALPKNVTNIGDYAFSGCGSMPGIMIPNSVMNIGDCAFSECSGLMNVTLPDSVTSIGYCVFDACSSLTSIRIPNSVTSIGVGAFNRCSNLMSIELSDRLENIGHNAFAQCSSLTSVEIPNVVTSIGDNTFSWCRSLKSITIPDSVASIGSNAFDICSSLNSVYITDLGAWCGISFGNDDANPLYYGNNLYINGTIAETLEIPEGIQLIPQNAFINGTCIERVALPKSLIGVAASAFSGCTGIEEAYYAGSESEWKALPIATGNDCLKNAKIYYNSTIDEHYCRIGVKVSKGGRISVDHSTIKAGDTVTVTAVPYEGYTLSAIYVDGEKIEGNTFIATSNHEVSALFTLLPVYGGTAEYRIEGIAVCNRSGEPLQELTSEKLLVSVSVENISESSGGTVMLAKYDAEGRYQGLIWVTLKKMSVGTSVEVTLPVDNSDGEIASLKAFMVSSILSPVPIGNAVSFGDIA